MDDEITEEQEQIDTDEEGISEELEDKLVKENLQISTRAMMFSNKNRVL